MEAFKKLKSDVPAWRTLVSTLVREARLPRPDPVAGDVVRALADAELCRLHGVLVGTVVFGVYPHFSASECLPPRKGTRADAGAICHPQDDRRVPEAGDG